MKEKHLHIADIHLRGGFGSPESKSLEKITELSKVEQPRYIFINGDIFDDASTPTQRLIFKKFLDSIQEIELVEKIIITRGNHDKIKDLLIFRDENVIVCESPKILDLDSIQCISIPHFNPTSIGLNAETNNEFFEKAKDSIDSMLDYFFQKIQNSEKPCVVVAHGCVTDAKLDNGYIPRDNGLHLNLQKLIQFNCPVVLGHYHKFQNVGGQVFYSGSTTRLNYGESEGDKGVLVYELENGKFLEKPRFISLNPSKMVLIDGVFKEGKFYYLENEIEKPLDEYPKEILKNSFVRYRYEIEKESLASIELSNIENFFKDSLEIKIEKRILTKNTERAKLKTNHMSEVLLEYLILREYSNDDILEYFKRFFSELQNDVNFDLEMEKVNNRLNSLETKRASKDTKIKEEPKKQQYATLPIIQGGLF